MATLLTKRPPFLAAGDLVLDVHGFTLTGPTGEVDLDRAPAVILKTLMRRPGVIVPMSDLINARWHDPMLEPSDPEMAIRMTVARLRDCIVQVGGARRQIRSIREMGYRIKADAQVVRAFTPEQAAHFDAWAATHPAFQPTVPR